MLENSVQQYLLPSIFKKTYYTIFVAKVYNRNIQTVSVQICRLFSLAYIVKTFFARYTYVLHVIETFNKNNKSNFDTPRKRLRIKKIWNHKYFFSNSICSLRIRYGSVTCPKHTMTCSTISQRDWGNLDWGNLEEIED